MENKPLLPALVSVLFKYMYRFLLYQVGKYIIKPTLGRIDLEILDQTFSNVYMQL